MNPAQCPQCGRPHEHVLEYRTLLQDAQAETAEWKRSYLETSKQLISMGERSMQLEVERNNAVATTMQTMQRLNELQEAYLQTLKQATTLAELGNSLVKQRNDAVQERDEAIQAAQNALAEWKKSVEKSVDRRPW